MRDLHSPSTLQPSCSIMRTRELINLYESRVKAARVDVRVFPFWFCFREVTNLYSFSCRRLRWRPTKMLMEITIMIQWTEKLASQCPLVWKVSASSSTRKMKVFRRDAVEFTSPIPMIILSLVSTRKMIPLQPRPQCPQINRFALIRVHQLLRQVRPPV